MTDILAKYTFLPWIRKGVSNQIIKSETSGVPTVDESQLRASISVDLKIKSGTFEHTTNKIINLVGPADITGINNQAIVRTEPTQAETNFEPNYLASIEFYDEDFAWRYSPAVSNANNQLRPWLFLVVLKESEFTKEDPLEDGKTVISITGDGAAATFLPKHDELAAWAHVHVNANLSDDSTTNSNFTNEETNDAVDRLAEHLKTNPDMAISRIVCPRKLEENTAYTAFLIPTYEVGRLAGLGADLPDYNTIPVQQSSWGTIHSGTYANKFPTYFNWFFNTGDKGDFESLVKKLKPKTLPPEVGRRPMDMQDSLYGLHYKVDQTATDPAKTTLSLEGALTVPGSSEENYPYQDQIDSDGITYREKLQDLINLNEDLKDLTSTNHYITQNFSGLPIENDPIISAPIYGRWHALKKTVDATNHTWINELNLDPRQRVVAGIGTSVMQANQDTFMDEAWSQVGDVIEANRKLYWAQLARETSRRIFDKHIKSQPDEKIWALTGKMKRKILNNDVNPKTLFQQVKESQLPLAAEDRAIRRIIRPVGPLMKKMDPLQSINSSSDNLIYKLDEKIVIAAQEKTEPVQATKTPIVNMDSGVQSVQSINNTNYNFAMSNYGSATQPSASNNTQAINMQNAVSALSGYFEATNWVQPADKSKFDVLNQGSILKEKINPLKTISARVSKTIKYDNQQMTVSQHITPIMAYPKFRQPMYESVRDISTDLLIPNLDLVPNNSISLLETNQKFIESFMVGLNHEMSRELLWREYPTDQRGSYFRQFWNISDNVNSINEPKDTYEESLYDIPKIHEWNANDFLGSNGSTPGSGNLVLMLRGDLLRKYPNAVIYAIKAKWKINGSVIDYSSERNLVTDSELFPIFSGKIGSDTTFLGFDLTEVIASGATNNEITNAITTPPSIPLDPGYFFVIRERPGEIRFGMDITDDTTASVEKWDELHWGLMDNTQRIDIGDLTIPTDPDLDITWGSQMNSAEMAMALYQNPVMVCVHANEMLNNI